ncbi:cellulose binding domain-containing protein [Glycomyces arizonensis]|uniref:cellulose binding domain-containing protein n=1 Tax=Glycomyces arizonensis TaxID=256035 RepID=UPI000409319C|nr:cellulose binding domain-containing protein [Glycomyces arizonensis]
MDDQTDGSPSRTGRLHGRLLQILALVSVLAALAAVWQFSPMLLGSEEEVAATWPWEDPVTVDFGAEPSSEAAVDSAEASSASVEPSPEAGSAAAEPESPAPSSEPVVEDDESGRDDATEAEPEPEGPACTASLELVSDWRGAVQVWVQVANTGTVSFERWEVTIAIDGVDLYEHWGMDHGDGDRYESEHWNGALDPGESADAAFQAGTEHDVALPDTVPCSAFA